MPFGMNKTTAMETENEDLQLCYKVFDILYVKGFKGEECNMSSFKLKDRHKVLKKIIKNKKNVYEFVEGLETNDFDVILKEFDNATTRSEEGVLIKNIDSEYLPNSRSIEWMKMKGDYLEGVTDTFDLLIVAGYFGT